MSASTQKLIRSYSRAGWSARITNGGHICLTHPAAKMPVFTGATPSDRRAPKAVQSMMRKALKKG